MKKRNNNNNNNDKKKVKVQWRGKGKKDVQASSLHYISSGWNGKGWKHQLYQPNNRQQEIFGNPRIMANSKWPEVYDSILAQHMKLPVTYCIQCHMQMWPTNLLPRCMLWVLVFQLSIHMHMYVG